MEQIKQIHTLFLNSKGVNTDTRTIQEGELFFALKGENFNGNKYALQAIENGAAYAIVDDPSLKNKSKQLILVENVLLSLQHLANYHRKYWGKEIIGITGSNGKTTSKELCAAVLTKKYNLHYTAGNFNNHIGVPLTLLKLKPEHELAIIEMGANHCKEIAELCTIAEPTHGLITNIGKAHLEGFGSEDNIEKTKRELFDWVREHNGKAAFVNSKDKRLNHEPLPKEKVYFNDNFSVINNSNFCVIEKKGTQYSSHLVGKINASNIDAAIVIGEYFGVSKTDIKSAIENYVPSNNRSQLIKTERNTIILDAYNANPSSMKIAIEDFANQTSDYSNLALIGEMKELGSESENYHKEIIELCKNLKLEAVFIGEFYQNLVNAECHYISQESEDLRIKLKDLKQKHILIKGSRSNKLENLVDLL